jgi:hypothetical protein
LGKPIPDVPMPKGNDKEEFSKKMVELYNLYQRQGLKNMVILFSLVAAGIAYHMYSR